MDAGIEANERHTNTRQNECCEQLAVENRRLTKALEKERQRKLYVIAAYKKLLDAYRSMVDLKEYVDKLHTSFLSLNRFRVFESSDSTIDESEHFKPQTGAPTTEEHENKENQPKTSTKVKMPEPSFPPKKSSETLIKGKSHVTFKEAQRVTTTSSEWYFLALDDEQEARKKVR